MEPQGELAQPFALGQGHPRRFLVVTTCAEHLPRSVLEAAGLDEEHASRYHAVVKWLLALLKDNLRRSVVTDRHHGLLLHVVRAEQFEGRVALQYRTIHLEVQLLQYRLRQLPE